MNENDNKELSLRGAAGDVAIPRDKASSSRGRAESSDVVISCDKVSSSRGRAESSDVVISCDKVLMNIRNNYCMSHLFNEIATSAFRLLAMTFSTLALAAVLSMGIVSESRADTCVSDGKSYNKGTYSDSGEECVSCGRNCNWSLNEGTLTISAKDGATNVATNEFYSYSYANPWKDSFSQITSVVVDEGISRIGAQAFTGAKNIESVSFTEGLESIGESAFSGAGLSGNLQLPNSLQTTGSSAFSSNHITGVNIPESMKIVNSSMFSSNDISSLEIPDWVTEIRNDAFSGNSIASLNIPSGVTLGWDAFLGQTDKKGYSESNYTLKSVTIADDVILGNRPFYNNHYIEELIIPDTLTAEQVAKWEKNGLFTSGGWGMSIKSIKCVGENGEPGDDEKCMAALSKFVIDEDGNCPSGRTWDGLYYCLTWAKQIGNTCINSYFAKDGVCISEYDCNRSGKIGNVNTRQCMNPNDCTNGYVIDQQKNRCRKMPGCVNFADGACQECDNGYLTNSSGACIPADDCKNGLHADGGACVANPEGCNTFENDHCTECNGGLLRQGAGCVSSCGEGYKLSNGACYRTHYTPAEAETVSGDTNTITLIYK